MDDLYGALQGLVPRDSPTSSNSSLNSGPPANRSASANHATLLVSWWCTSFALVIILVRLWGRYERTRKFFMEDKIMALSIIPLLIRMGFAHPILLWGTNNISTVDVTLSPEQLYHHSLGGRLVLGARIFYALFIWTAKFTVSEYLKRLVSAIWTERYQFVLRCIRIFLLVTFAAVVIATLTECMPFDHYWQVIPDPGPRCRNGYAQLLTMGTCDIITDILLIAFPIHLLWKSTMPTKRKLSLSVLFSLSLILIAITSYRMVAIVEARGRQQLRTLWASLEILAAAAVSNALVLGSFLRDRGVKKAKYRGSSRSRSDSTAVAEPSINRTMTQQHWGNDSDEDLFKSLRGRLGSVADTVSSSSKVPPWPSQRYIRANSDPESNAVEEENEAQHGEAVWKGEEESKEKFVVSQESSSLATSWSSEAHISQPERAQTSSTIAHDFATWGNGFTSQRGHDLTSFSDAGGLLQQTPPPTAAVPLQRLRAGSSDIARANSTASSTHYAFHTPQRAPRFAPPSPTQQASVPPATGPLSPITRTDTSISSTPTLQDAGGLLGFPHVSQPHHHDRVSSDVIRARTSLGDGGLEDPSKSHDHPKHQLLGLASWRRPSRKEGAQTLSPQSDPKGGKRPSRQVDPMDLQDPGGLLGP